MKDALVVVYSHTGVSRQLAKLLCAQMGWELGTVVEVRRRAGAAGTVRCLVDSLLRRRPAVDYQGPPPSEFETVVLVSPIWAYRLPGPMRSFIHDHRAQLRQVAVVSTMGSRGASNAVAEVAHLLGHAPLLAQAFTAREVEDGSCATQLEAFGRAIREATDAHRPVPPAAWKPRPA